MPRKKWLQQLIHHCIKQQSKHQTQSKKDLGTVTRCCLTSLTAFFRLYKMLQQTLILDGVRTTRESWSNFTGCQCSVLNFSWLFWFTRCWMACPRSTWQMPAYHFYWLQMTSNVQVTTCQVPRTSDKLFTVAGPYLWNNLPFHPCDSELTLMEFDWSVKMHLSVLRTASLVAL